MGWLRGKEDLAGETKYPYAQIMGAETPFKDSALNLLATVHVLVGIRFAINVQDLSLKAMR